MIRQASRNETQIHTNVLNDINNDIFTWFIERRNERAEHYKLPFITHCISEENNYVRIYNSNWDDHTQLKTMMKRLYLILSLQEKFEPGDYINNYSSITATKKYRQWFSYPVNSIKYYKGIFVGIESNWSNMNLRLIREDWQSTTYSLYSFFFKKEEYPRYNDEEIKSYFSGDKDIEEKILKAYDSAESLHFIASLDIIPEGIRITFKEYVLDLMNGFSMNMPKIEIVFDLHRKRFVPWITVLDATHPHIGSYICMWWFESVLNKEWYKFDIALITLYDHLCTYNLNSPFFRPYFNNEQRMKSEGITISYEDNTYKYDEWTKFMEENDIVKSKFYKTIYG